MEDAEGGRSPLLDHFLIAHCPRIEPYQPGDCYKVVAPAALRARWPRAAGEPEPEPEPEAEAEVVRAL